MAIDKKLKKYFSEIGKKGGSVSSQAKKDAAKKREEEKRYVKILNNTEHAICKKCEGTGIQVFLSGKQKQCDCGQGEK